MDGCSSGSSPLAQIRNHVAGDLDKDKVEPPQIRKNNETSFRSAIDKEKHSLVKRKFEEFQNNTNQLESPLPALPRKQSFSNSQVDTSGWNEIYEKSLTFNSTDKTKAGYNEPSSEKEDLSLSAPFQMYAYYNPGYDGRHNPGAVSLGSNPASNGDQINKPSKSDSHKKPDFKAKL